ncbi:benzoyl-CoA 2,3-epoxidase subunit BoxB [Polyangium jinanense]|uniref:benzoyl-CoA 2,3-epoxidase subunit BoxB n=1 Tax=Polyangium jinanense TaxID=2829994 RepID=UPI002341EA21|nr:benzoyl-CoA 2,3-epoxidase subunit BoxB [Polyangium jinanense]MDC3960070.1 benzoyl-CoA 2,3-epoxidase subunit BoxB [Polyangium jinanense]
MSSVVNSERIPNNVDLASDKKLQRALEAWQPRFIDWWKEMGPEGFQEDQIYLRTAVSVDHEGWAHFDYVKMPDYRWGIFLTDPVAERKIGFGDHMGEPVWQSVPGEFRNVLRRLVVTQGDTEPASVEQQRLLGQSCPSLYDLRNLFQVNVEEGRHLWAMVYLLHSYFGRDGREEAEALLERRSGNPDKPRILGAFNEPCQNWLSFFMFTYFTDRDGKYQLLALAESGFDPLARTTRFMLTEEAHHMFVGETGILRIVQRTAELMKKNKNEDARAEGGIDLPTMQKYLNFWYSVSLDLFGGEISSNAANFFASSLKGRAKEESYEDHRAVDGVYPMDVPVTAGPGVVTGFRREEVPLRNAMNEVLRDEYIEDAQRGVDKWNRALAEAGISYRLTLPSRRFHRRTGIYGGLYFDVQGNVLAKEDWERRRDEWLPSEADEAYVKSLMTAPIYDPKQMANWIAPPKHGIKGRPVDFEYVKRTA